MRLPRTCLCIVSASSVPGELAPGAVVGPDLDHAEVEGTQPLADLLGLREGPVSPENQYPCSGPMTAQLAHSVRLRSVIPRPLKWRVCATTRVSPSSNASHHSISTMFSSGTPQASRWAPTPRGTRKDVPVNERRDGAHVEVVVAVAD